MRQVAILKKLATKNANTRKDIIITPDECKLELYPRTSQLSVFDRLDLICELTPGKDDKGAIFKGFINAIQIHDEIIKDMEERMKHIEYLKSDLKKKTRLYANYTAAWAVMFSSMGSYNEYKEAKIAMLTWDQEYQGAIERQHKEGILRLENFKKHFEALQKVNGPIEKMEDAVADALDSRNEAARILQDAEMALDKLRIVERRAADKITDDHIHADEQRVPFSDLFPSLRST
jgi:hypothetical protein